MDIKAKAETLEQKILEVLREEIGVDVGEEFDVYSDGLKLWTCRFEVNGFSYLKNGEFLKSKVWKELVYRHNKYQFTVSPFIPKDHEEYWYVSIGYNSNGDRFFDVTRTVLVGTLFDYGMLALGNVFRTKDEALKNKDKILEKMEKLLKGGSNEQLQEWRYC